MSGRALPMRIYRQEDEEDQKLPELRIPDAQYDPDLVRRMKSLIIHHLSGRYGDEDPKHNYEGAFTINAAARQAGVPIRVVRMWMDADEKFRDATEDAIDDALGIAVSREYGRALKVGGKALATIVEYRKAGMDRNASKTVRLVRKSTSDGVL